ncbi:MAG TPA: hypothetical protein ENG33_07585 [Chloroflexi bacterium]|nr:hypothetical protein [Chloroflexota bacterium]
MSHQGVTALTEPCTPTIQELQAARQVYESIEPRDLFYRVATELVDLALRGAISLSVAESLAVLLQTWNKAFYRYRPFDNAHFFEIERLITTYQPVLSKFRKRTIESFGNQDEVVVKTVFKAFEEVLGPVGAAKCLHLLAPRFFPLWDRAIAKAYGVPLGRKGSNADRYCTFLRITKEQIEALGGEQVIGRNPLKAIDEYNYCRYTKGWI